MFKDELRRLLKQQFYLFLNFALRNLWIIRTQTPEFVDIQEEIVELRASLNRGKLTTGAYRKLLGQLESRKEEMRVKSSEPKSLRERQSQIKSFLHTIGLGDDMHCSEGELICTTYRARELRDLMIFLMQKISSRDLKKLAEKKNGDLKITILTHPEGFRTCDLLPLSSYREKISRALKVLVEAKLLKKEGNRYYHTQLGTEIARELEYCLNRWIDGQLHSLFHYLEAANWHPQFLYFTRDQNGIRA